MKKFKFDTKGFSLVEISVVVAVMIVLLAILVPSFVKYTENSRVQKDDSAMDELCQSIRLAMADSQIFDEVCSYAMPNNFVTYTDSSGVYGAKYTDEEFWAPDGSGNGVTITFNPDENGNYVIADGLVNDMTLGNGSVAESREAEGLRQCDFDEMGQQKLYHKVEQTFGSTFYEKSSTYQNSSYTVFITFDVANGIKRADIHGEWNGTNLDPSCPASLGSGTTEYTPDDEPITTNPGGTTPPQFDSSDLTGSGSTTGDDPILDPPAPAEDELPPGLYQPGSIEAYLGGADISSRMIRSWEDLLADGTIHVTNGRLVSNYAFASANLANNYNNSSDALAGDLVISDDVIEVGNFVISTYDFAFCFCKNLTGVYVPKEVKQLGYYAFYGCESLETFHIEEGTSLTPAKISSSVFFRSGLKSFAIPSGWDRIPASMFAQCASLESVTIPASVKTIEQRAFERCTSLRTINFAANGNLETIDDFAFWDTSISSVEIPNTVNYIGWQAFCGIPSLTSVTFEDGGAEPLIIEGAMFQSDTALTHLELPHRTAQLGNNLFSSCTSNTITIIFDGTRAEWAAIPQGSNMNMGAVKEVICLDGNGCPSHTGGTATCTAQKICTNCGFGYGALAAHKGGTATCIAKKICTVCNQEYGDFAAHKGGTATCTKLKECTVCGQEYGSLASHTGGTATCVKLKECTKCGQEYGSLLTTHTGGTATCKKQANCDLCGVAYGAFADHELVGNVCQICGTGVTVIESPHDYTNNMNYVILGQWDYSDAKSVNITVEYLTEMNYYDWVSLAVGHDYLEQVSSGYDFDYITTSGTIGSYKGNNAAVKFGGTTRTKVSFSNIEVLQGTVVFRSDSSTVKWGAKVTITPNY